MAEGCEDVRRITWGDTNARTIADKVDNLEEYQIIAELESNSLSVQGDTDVLRSRLIRHWLRVVSKNPSKIPWNPKVDEVMSGEKRKMGKAGKGAWAMGRKGVEREETDEESEGMGA